MYLVCITMTFCLTLTLTRKMTTFGCFKNLKVIFPFSNVTFFFTSSPRFETSTKKQVTQHLFFFESQLSK